MISEPVKVIYDQDKQRRVVIFRRDDGTYSYEEESFSAHEYEKCWIPKKQHRTGFYDSQQTALKEAMGNIEWLSKKLHGK